MSLSTDDRADRAEATLEPELVADPVAARAPRRHRLSSYGPPLVVLALILLVWFAVSAYLDRDPPNILLPSPWSILDDSFLSGETITGDLLDALWLTVKVALIGLAISIVIGVVWAVLMSQARWVERSLFPYAVILQTIPILALVPLIGNTLGFSTTARIFVCVLISLFPMVSNTLFGLQAVERSQRELFRLQRASRWTVLTKLQLPNAMPAVFAGMRISAGLSIVGAIVGDFFFRRGQPGLGILINNYASRLQTSQLFATILTAALLGVVIFLLFGWLARLAVGRWYEPSS